MDQQTPSTTPDQPDEHEDPQISSRPRSELDDEEGADVFETRDEAKRSERHSHGERRDEDHVSLDTPD